jgi:hypothetical protein
VHLQTTQTWQYTDYTELRDEVRNQAITEIRDNTNALFDTTNTMQKLYHKINSKRMEAMNTM